MNLMRKQSCDGDSDFYVTYYVVVWFVFTDGTIIIYVQPSSPGPELEPNWLPTPPNTPFTLWLRAYDPQEIIKNGTYWPDALKKVVKWSLVHCWKGYIAEAKCFVIFLSITFNLSKDTEIHGWTFVECARIRQDWYRNTLCIPKYKWLYEQNILRLCAFVCIMCSSRWLLLSCAE